jgi:hypothetical protein
MLKVSPLAGVIAPYSSARLCVRFKPFSLDGGRGFRAQPLSPQQQAQPFDGLLQVGLSNSGHDQQQADASCPGLNSRKPFQWHCSCATHTHTHTHTHTQWHSS